MIGYHARNMYQKRTFLIILIECNLAINLKLLPCCYLHSPSMAVFHNCIWREESLKYIPFCCFIAFSILIYGFQRMCLPTVVVYTNNSVSHFTTEACCVLLEDKNTNFHMWCCVSFLVPRSFFFFIG